MQTLAARALLHTLGVRCWYRAGTPLPMAACKNTACALMRKSRGRALRDPDLLSFQAELSAMESEQDQQDVELAVLFLTLEDLVEVVDGNLVLRSPKAALAVRGEFEPRNLTAVWMDSYLTPTVYAELVRHIASRTKHSRDGDEIRELTHEFVRRFIKADSLRKRLLEGRVPSPGEVRSWAWRRVLSIFRDEGIDAQTRTIKSARTDRDLEDKTPESAYKMDPSSHRQAILAVDEGSETGLRATASNVSGGALVDVVDSTPSFEEVFEHQEFARSRMARLEAAVRAYKSTAPDRYARVLAHMAAGKTVEEIADLEEVSRNRAAAIVAEVRVAGRNLVEFDAVRRKIMEYVQAEPMATLDDLVSDLAEDRALVSRAVTDLLSAGALQRAKGSLVFVREIEL